MTAEPCTRGCDNGWLLDPESLLPVARCECRHRTVGEHITRAVETSDWLNDWERGRDD